MMCDQQPELNQTLSLREVNLNASSETVSEKCNLPQKFGIQMDFSHFFKTNQGFLKLLQLAIGIACIACVAPALRTYSLPIGSYWFLAATIFCVILTFIWILIYLLCLKNYAKTFPWNFFESILVICLAILYAAAGISQLVVWSKSTYIEVKEENIIAGSLALFNVVCHCISLYYAMSKWCRELNAD